MYTRHAQMNSLLDWLNDLDEDAVEAALNEMSVL